MEKGYWEKLLEEHPEGEKVIKDSFGYQAEQLSKAIDEFVESVTEELMPYFKELEKLIYDMHPWWRKIWWRIIKYLTRLKRR